jgi:hypothetical protein
MNLCVTIVERWDDFKGWIMKDATGDGCSICEGSVTTVATTDQVQLRKTFWLLGPDSIPDFLNNKSDEGHTVIHSYINGTTAICWALASSSVS